MRKIILNTIIIIILSSTFFNCNKKDLKNEIDSETNVLYQDNNFNKDFSNLSIVLSKALNDSKEFRSKVKSEALIMFDGDYDILLKDFKNKMIKFTDKSEPVSIKDFLTDYYPKKTQKSGGNIIDSLTEIYPDLQISVPVHAEDWDENFIPRVAFIPVETNNDTEILPGYYNEDEIEIDAVNRPDDPVVVVGLSERSAHPGPGPTPAPPTSVDITVAGITTESGIRLTWTIENQDGDILGYNIYRKSAGQNDYLKVGYNSGVDNMTYDDIEVISNTSYSYYVKARGPGSLSEKSNTINITAPILTPSDLTSFDVTQYAINDVEARWTLDPEEYYGDLILSRRVVGSNTDYVPIETFDPNGQHYYLDNDIEPGENIIYKIHNQTQQGESNPKFDFIHTPYRDISGPTPVYIRAIACDEGIEQWYYGYPEFKITIAGVNPITNTSFPIQDKIKFDFVYGDDMTVQYFNDRLVYMWETGTWHDMISFHVVEYDNERLNATFTFSAKYKTKNADNTAFGIDAGLDFTYDLSSKDFNCGNSYYTYYEPTYKWLVFPVYGLEILVSPIGH